MKNIPDDFFTHETRTISKLSNDFNTITDTKRLSDPLFKAVAYPSKIYYKNIEKFINRYTTNDAVILDTFSGSGSTGIASAELNRKAVLIDDSPYAHFIESNLFLDYNFTEIENTFKLLEKAVKPTIDNIYKTIVGDGDYGVLENLISSNIYRCQECGHDFSLYKTETGKRSEYKCPNCGTIINIAKKNIKETKVASRKPVFATIKTSSGKIQKNVTEEDIVQWDDNIRQVLKENEDLWEPEEQIVYNRAYPRVGGWPGFPIHSKVGALFSEKNLLALKILRHYIMNNKQIEHSTSDFFMYVFTESLFRSSSRLFTSSGIKNVYHIPPVGKEQNVLIVFKRKYKAILKAFKYADTIMNADSKKNILTFQGNARKLDFKSNLFDYAFIDPPYGGMVPYAELNLFYSAWLNKKEDLGNEVIIPMDYEKKEEWAEKWGSMIKEAFGEIYRVLKPGAYLTIVFQSKFSTIWNVLKRTMVDDLGFQFVEFISDERGATFHTNQLNDTNPVSAYITYKKPDSGEELSSQKKPVRNSQNVFKLLTDNDREKEFRELQSYIIQLSNVNDIDVPSDSDIRNWLNK